MPLIYKKGRVNNKSSKSRHLASAFVRRQRLESVTLARKPFTWSYSTFLWWALEKEAFLRKIFEEVTDEEGRRPLLSKAQVTFVVSALKCLIYPRLGDSCHPKRDLPSYSVFTHIEEHNSTTLCFFRFWTENICKYVITCTFTCSRRKKSGDYRHMNCTAKTAISCVSDTPGCGSWQEAFISWGKHFSGAVIIFGLGGPMLDLTFVQL